MSSKSGSETERLRQEKLRRQIEAATLDLERARGNLIDRKAALRTIENRAAFERDAWIGWASAVSATLAGELGCDPARTFAVLDREIRAQLDRLAETRLDLAPKRRAGRPRKADARD